MEGFREHPNFKALVCMDRRWRGFCEISEYEKKNSGTG
jgi:hypothetical protein